MANALQHASSEARSAIVKKETIRRRMRRQKRGVQPPEPQSVSEIRLPDNFTSTGEATPQSFLIHDSGPTAPKRMLVFASEKQLQHLASAESLFFTVLFNKWDMPTRAH